MAKYHVKPYPLPLNECKEICDKAGLRLWTAVREGYISRDDYNNLGRGRYSKALGRNLFFFCRDFGAL